MKQNHKNNLAVLLFSIIMSLLTAKLVNDLQIVEAWCNPGDFCYFDPGYAGYTRVTDEGQGCILFAGGDFCTVNYFDGENNLVQIDPHYCVDGPADCTVDHYHVTDCTWDHGEEDYTQGSTTDDCANEGWVTDWVCGGTWGDPDPCCLDTGIVYEDEATCGVPSPPCICDTCYDWIPDTCWHCRVWRGEHCDETWSTETFSCCKSGCPGPPESPDLSSPGNGSTVSDDNNITFQWIANDWGDSGGTNGTCDGKSFRLQVDNNNDFSSPEYDESGIGSGTTSRTVVFNQPEGTYYWRVSAINEVDGTWSPTWSFTLDYVPPTAEFTNPTTDITVGPGTMITFDAQASDPGGAMTRMQVMRYDTTDPLPLGPNQAPTTRLGLDEACSGVNCSLTRWWTPTDSDIGVWQVFINAYDENEAFSGGKCTGFTNIPASWGDCNTGNNPDLITVTVQNTPPNSGDIIGPTEVPNPNTPGSDVSYYSGFYNFTYSDADNQEVLVTWSSPDCAITLPEIDHIDIWSEGVDGGTGIYPDMDVVVGDPDAAGGYGERRTVCSFNSVDSYQNRPCSINDSISSLDIVFPNDAGGTDLRIDYIDVYFTDDGSSRTIQAEAQSPLLDSDYVYQDRGSSEPRRYDGLNVTNGEWAFWNAAFRFPIPIYFNPATSPGSCTLRAVPRDTAVPPAEGAAAEKIIDICGAAPEAVTLITPSDGEQNVLYGPVNFDWDDLDPVTGWGDNCGGPIRTYTAYASSRVGGVCSPNPADYTPLSDDNDGDLLPDCADLGDSECSYNSYFSENSEYCWYVEADNGEFVSQSPTWWFETYNPVLDKNWVTTLYGDFYAGTIGGVGGVGSMEFPGTSDYILGSDWDPPHLSYEDSADPIPVPTISSFSMDIDTDDSTAGYTPESQSGFYVKHASFTDTWPTSYKGNAPSGAISLPRSGESCEDIFVNVPPNSRALRPREVYTASLSCVQDGLNNLSSDYEVQNPGVATLYVEGNGDLDFEKPFLAENNNKRILFVPGDGVNVKISNENDLEDAAYLNPDVDSAPLIEAAFVVLGSIEFQGTTDPDNDPDKSLVVEGPIITKSAQFNRNRGSDNGYPSEIIKYNADYIYELTKKERESEEANVSGLFVVDVDWISEE